MKIFKNRAWTMILIILILGTLAGCGKEKSKDVSIEDINQKINQEVDLSSMVKGDMEQLEKLYDIEKEKVDSFVLYTASTNIKADEIAIVKVKDSNDIEKVQEAFQNRIDKQSKAFQDYLPEEYFLIENHVLKNNGEYIIFIISKDTQKIEEIVDGCF
ncbi:DUF4358 domain-containing protein [Inediibacterium massiliense]|uniref:DUF4358 domain-containing protein n=1 Tax=Inediibacterium massiliense TaxID=1658111 RepID=UPI0006B5E977|nr:DUF4358 domain-containing protein [Inediibacterium massiliense]